MGIFDRLKNSAVVELIRDPRIRDLVIRREFRMSQEELRKELANRADTELRELDVTIEEGFLEVSGRIKKKLLPFPIRFSAQFSIHSFEFSPRSKTVCLKVEQLKPVNFDWLTKRVVEKVPFLSFADGLVTVHLGKIPRLAGLLAYHIRGFRPLDHIVLKDLSFRSTESCRPCGGNAVTDYLVRIITRSGNFRALACVTTGLVSEACRRHGTRPTASAALGRALTGGALFGALLKTGQRVGLRFEGNGPLKKIIVEAESNGAVCGYVGEPEAELPDRDGKLDVAGALGRAGFLTVTKDLGLKAPYRGMVQLQSSEIGDDLAYYLTSSEQIPSAVGLGVLVTPDGSIAAAGGFLIQALPPQDESTVDLLMERIAQLPRLSHLLAEGTNPEGLLERLFAGHPLRYPGEAGPCLPLSLQQGKGGTGTHLLGGR